MQLESRCGVTFPFNFGRRKRNVVQFPVVNHNIMKRQSTTAAKEALQQTVTCSQSVSNLFDNLPEQLCNNSVLANDECNCWNGTSNGR